MSDLHSEAVAAWEEAQKATVRARNDLLSAKEKVREAERQLQSAIDTQRNAWVAVRDAEWLRQKQTEETAAELVSLATLLDDAERGGTKAKRALERRTTYNRT